MLIAEIIEISGMKMIAVFSSDTISPKVIVLLFFSTTKGGGEISGNPPGTLPGMSGVLIYNGKKQQRFTLVKIVRLEYIFTKIGWKVLCNNTLIFCR